MKNYKLNIIVVFIFSAILFNGCTEAYPLLTNTYEEVLVVEATITNELKNQEIKLTKTARFEDETYLPESGAEVFITDDSGNKYNFTEDTDKYISTVEFQAIPQRKYQLHINTKDGRSFESSPETLTTINPMQEVTATVEEKDKVNGVAIRIKSFDASHASTYYRYDYEETYKIVTPKWRPTKAIIGTDGRISFVTNSSETKICYGSKKSSELLLASTNDLSEDRVNFLARFISDQNYIITTRYSILVRQYIESLAAFNYYTTLKKLSGPESVLSPTQPGILLGNIKSANNPNNKIVGYFDVASVSTERIYFNYDDLFPGKAAPPFVTDCLEFCYGDVEAGTSPVPCTHVKSPVEDLSFGFVTYYTGIDAPGSFSYWVNAPCGDCTTFASNMKPVFWAD
jgi:hypothetical protein